MAKVLPTAAELKQKLAAAADTTGRAAEKFTEAAGASGGKAAPSDGKDLTAGEVGEGQRAEGAARKLADAATVAGEAAVKVATGVGSAEDGEEGLAEQQKLASAADAAGEIAAKLENAGAAATKRERFDTAQKKLASAAAGA